MSCGNLCLRCSSSSPSPSSSPSSFSRSTSPERTLEKRKRTRLICEHLREIGQSYENRAPLFSLLEKKMTSLFSQKPPSLTCSLCSKSWEEGWVCLTCHQFFCSHQNSSHVWDHIDQHHSLEKKGEMWKRKGGREKIEMNGFGKEEREEGGTFEIGGKEEEEEEEDVHCCFGHFPSTRIHCFVCSLEATSYSNCPSCQTVRIHLEEDGIQLVRSLFFSKEEKKLLLDRHTMSLSARRQKKTIDSVEGFCGLRNLGNTCYFNSAIQCLANCEPLSSFFHFELEKYCRNLKHRKSDLSKVMGELFREMWFGDYTRLSPTRLLNQVGRADSMFRSYAQQDAHELLRCVLGALDDELQSPDFFSDCEMISKEAIEGPASPYTSARIPRQPSLRRSREIQPTNGFVNHIKGERNQKGSKQQRSIISELFEGVFESHLVCHRCQSSSFSREAFYDLSLSIPTYAKMEEIHTEFEKDGIDQPPPPRPGFFRRMFMAISVASAPAVPLVHCLKDFCLTESLEGEQKYHCEKCKDYTEAHRSISFLRLPEILCLHLKRFHFDGYYSSKISTPISFEEYIDMSHFLKKDERKKGQEGMGYRLFGVVTHYGAAGGGHYVSFARNPQSGVWCEFNDSLVTEVTLSTVLNTEAYILFYQRIQSQDRLDDIQEIQELRQISKNQEIYYVSRFWWQLWKYTSLEIPISNVDVACPHGFVRKMVFPTSSRSLSTFHFPVKSVPASVWQRLKILYGGGPSLSSNLVFCKLCKSEEQRGKKEAITKENEKEETEYQIVSKKDRRSLLAGENCDNDRRYLIDCEWLQKWIKYSKQLSGVHPGPISNQKLLDMAGIPHSDLKVAEDYRGLVPPVWNFLHQKYGGGPIIARPSVNIYDQPSPLSEY